ncbi:MAG: phasin family protein [Pseudomonadota bacterium]|nr:phasin family protein [Pseudomonadota bacterium]
MQTDYLESWTSLSNSAYASFKELGEIGTKATEKLAEHQLGFLSTFMDTGVKHLTLYSEANGYKDLLSGFTKLSTEYNDKLLDTLRKTTEVLTESKDEFTAWADKAIDAGLAPIKKATVLPAKKVAAAS